MTTTLSLDVKKNIEQQFENKIEPIEKVLIKNPRYRNGYDKWVSEFKIDGYVIEVYDEKTYNREKNLEELGI